MFLVLLPRAGRAILGQRVDRRAARHAAKRRPPPIRERGGRDHCPISAISLALRGRTPLPYRRPASHLSLEDIKYNTHSHTHAHTHTNTHTHSREATSVRPQLPAVPARQALGGPSPGRRGATLSRIEAGPAARPNITGAGPSPPAPPATAPFVPSMPRPSLRRRQR